MQRSREIAASLCKTLTLYNNSIGCLEKCLQLTFQSIEIDLAVMEPL